jgi:ABC-type long-subunit fatty acid transport system fused permease/ATPase subunit
MKTIKIFFSEARLWQLFIALGFFFFVIIFMLIWWVSLTQTNPISMKPLVDVSLFLSIVFSLILTLFQYLIRQSEKFWEHAHILEEKIESAEDKETLDTLFTEDFQILRGMSAGGPHHEELRKLHTIMKTKYKYVK